MKNLLMEQMHLNYLLQEYKRCMDTKNKDGLENPELKILMPVDLVAWRQKDIQGLTLQRPCAVAEAHEMQAVSWPDDA